MAMGRGLEELLSDTNYDYDRELNKEKVASIKISQITPNPFQPRTFFDEEALQELSESIKEHGLIQPIVVIKKAENEYTLVAGERRLRATKILGDDEIKAIILNIDKKNLHQLALIENIQRENLNPLELANSLKELISEHKITQEELANLVKKSRSWVANTLRLLNLDEKTKELIKSGKISSGHAKVLVGLDKKDEKMLADSIVGQKLSVRETEELAQKIKKPQSKTELEKKIMGLKDCFKSLGICASSNKNKLTLSFENSKEIENLIVKLSKF